MTPEEYCAQLRDAQRTLDSVKEGLDRAIHSMQRRLETGCNSMEQDSRLEVLAGREYVKLTVGQLLTVATAKIEY